MTFKTNDIELAATIADDNADTNESNKIPGGILGFSLDYAQIPC